MNPKSFLRLLVFLVGIYIAMGLVYYGMGSFEKFMFITIPGTFTTGSLMAIVNNYIDAYKTGDKIMEKKKAKRSYYDDGGLLWVACCECNRGGNGADKDKCSSGWQCKRWNGLGCFLGELLDNLTVGR